MLPADTLRQPHRVQVEVWRRMGPAGRSRAAASLSQALMNTARAQIVAAHPDLSQQELALALILRLHGSEIAGRVNEARQVRTP